jgi:hypothetical protein
MREEEGIHKWFITHYKNILNNMSKAAKTIKVREDPIKSPSQVNLIEPPVGNGIHAAIPNWVLQLEVQLLSPHVFNSISPN